MNTRRIILSLSVILTLVASTVLASSAYFTDTESSTNNVLVAGAIDLKIDNESYYNGEESPSTTWITPADLNDGNGPANGAYLFFNFNDLKPGDWGEDTISVHVDSNPAYACIDFSLTANDDNTSVEPELEAGDTLDVVEDLFDGELAQQLQFIFWVDDGDNVLEEDEVQDIIVEGPAIEVLSSEWPIADATTGTVVDPQNPTFIGKAWCFGTLTPNPVTPGENSPTDDPGILCSPNGATNIAQTDIVNVDVLFTAVQVRHNEEFECETCEDTTEVWAVEAYDLNQGTTVGGGSVAGDRSVPANATGSPDEDFVSLGIGGSIVVSFDSPVEDVPGVDLSFHEVTNGRDTYPVEKAMVEVNKDGEGWVLIGSVTNKDNGDGVAYLDFSSSEYDYITEVRITDTTDAGLHNNAGDGYDLDSVDALICVDDRNPNLVANDR